MKHIRVSYTDQGRIIAIARPTTIAELLEADERIVNSWYYDQPKELESFLKERPEKEEYVLKAFAYWVMCKLFGLESDFKEDQNNYGKLKRELQQFSHKLFKSLRAIAGKIAQDIHRFLNPKSKKIY